MENSKIEWAVKDHELKLMDLATQCGILIAADEVAQVFGAKKSEEMALEARTKANALARELFPPMAKPLVWVRQDDGSLVAGDYYYRNGEACWRDEGVFFDEAPPGYLYDVAAAKAACESHHQARFLEQLA